MTARGFPERQAKVPQRPTAGVDASFHPDIDGEARLMMRAASPVMPRRNLRFRIKDRVREGEFDL